MIALAAVAATPPLPSYPSFVQAERVIVEPTNRQPGWILHNFSTACHHASARLPPSATKIDETTIDWAEATLAEEFPPESWNKAGAAPPQATDCKAPPATVA